jgi:hypothetical protein
MTKKFVLAALSVAALSGCIKGADVDKTDFGPEEKIEDVSNALSKPTEGMNPLDIKVGEFFAIEDTQELAGGAAFAILKDTGATITGKTEDSTHVMFSGVIHEATYQNDGSVSKVSREGNLLCVSKVQGGCGEESSSSVKTLAFTSPEKLLSQAVNTKAVRQTFHKLTTSVQQVQPPARVRARPNCLGIPNCLITIHRIGFDQVIWEDEKPTRVHIDAVMSADVPYLSRNLSTCYTAVADVDSSTGGVLVKQCSNIFDFKFSDAQ